MANYYEEKSLGTVNPYNFVRLGNGVKRNSVKKGDNTGVIRCRLITRTPLSIPDMPLSTGGPKEHKVSGFIKVDGNPIIPGSEIKGVIRSAYETLSNSCLSVNNNNILSARSSAVRNPGILRYEADGWHLYEASEKKLPYGYHHNECECNEPNTFIRQWMNHKYVKGPDGKSRPLRKEGKIEVSYQFTTSFKEIHVKNLADSVSDYNEACRKYASNENEKKLSKYIVYADEIINKCYTVYYQNYSADGQNFVYLSPARISRSVFRKKVDDLLGEYRHCTDPDNLCDACRLFGMIGDGKNKGSNNKKSAVSSRVRFCDAVIENSPKYKTATLKELSGPKISSVEFYSQAKNMNSLWTYDYDGVSLNGRKYYFHHDNNDYSTDERTNRNMTTELIDKGAVFSFDIFFENITDRELKELVWVLAIGENNPDGKQMHKIGHGKPLGLGSVKITVDSVKKRTFDSESLVYSEENISPEELLSENPFDENADYFRDFMNITDFTYLNGKKVAYPYGEENKNGKCSTGTLTWFKANRNDGGTSNEKKSCQIRYHLPRIADKNNLSLPALIAKNNNSNNNNRHNNRKPNYKK